MPGCIFLPQEGKHENVIPNAIMDSVAMFKVSVQYALGAIDHFLPMEVTQSLFVDTTTFLNSFLRKNWSPDYSDRNLLNAAVRMIVSLGITAIGCMEGTHLQ
jgi:hypothetical protein